MPSADVWESGIDPASGSARQQRHKQYAISSYGILAVRNTLCSGALLCDILLAQSEELIQSGIHLDPPSSMPMQHSCHVSAHTHLQHNRNIKVSYSYTELSLTTVFKPQRSFFWCGEIIIGECEAEKETR